MGEVTVLQGRFECSFAEYLCLRRIERTALVRVKSAQRQAQTADIETAAKVLE